MGNAYVMEALDTSHLDRLLLDAPGGQVVPVPYGILECVPDAMLLQWGVRHGIYQYCTCELIAWLRVEIAGRSCIEICAGSSGIGRALGIHATDSYMHQIPEVRALYQAWMQTPTDPPPYVQKIEANAAVKKYDPEVVLGCFVTQRYLSPADKDGNAFGPLEEEWLDDGKVYIHVGNLNVHSTKRILSRPHKCLEFPWLFSRCGGPANGRIWIWEPGLNGTSKRRMILPGKKRRGKGIGGLKP